MKDNFTITEVKQWDYISEFTFDTISGLKFNLKKLLFTKKINLNKKYKVTIKEI